MAKERVLITGCGGMLGAAVYGVFRQNNEHVLATDIDLNEPWLSRLDVREIADCERTFEAFRPTLVLHLAALTDLEYCERNPDDCWRTNALGTENVAFLAKRFDATMVYIGTAGIFNGAVDLITDFDLPDPLSLYGKSKYHGERFVERYLTKYFVFRAGWMMGGGPRKDGKFINKIYKQIIAGRRELFVVDDKLGAPTYTVNFAESMFKVLGTGYYGLYNQVCGGGCSRLEVAREFLSLLGLTDKIKLTAVTSQHFQDEYFAARPRSEQLVNLKLNARGINYMRPWKECLADYSRIFARDLHARV